MTDLQQLIALGPVQAQVSIPVDVLEPPRRKLRHSQPQRGGAALSDAELSQLRTLGVDLDVLGI